MGEIKTVYDLAGRAVSVTDAMRNTTNTEYDNQGRAVNVTTPFNNTTSGEVKTYYDKNSDIIKNSEKMSRDRYIAEQRRFGLYTHFS